MERQKGKKQSKQLSRTERRRSARLNSSREQQQQQSYDNDATQLKQQSCEKSATQQQQQSCDNNATELRLTRKRTCQNGSRSPTQPTDCAEEKSNTSLTKKSRKKAVSRKDIPSQQDVTAVDGHVVMDCSTLSGEIKMEEEIRSNQTESASNVDSSTSELINPAVSSDPLRSNAEQNPVKEEDSDDDLPSFMSLADDKFKVGDLVWAKCRGSCFWPALVLRLKYCRKKLHKVKVAFIEYEKKQLKSKPFWIRYRPERIQPITKNYQQYVIVGKNSSNSVYFQEAIERVEEYMFSHAETLPNAIEFFEIESTKSKNKEHEELAESVGGAYISLASNHSADDTPSENSDESGSSDGEEAGLRKDAGVDFSEETRRHIEERCRNEEELIKYIISSNSVKEHLKAVRLEQKQSIFQTNFKNQHKTRQENFAIITQGFGPLRYDSSMTLTKFLQNFICEVDQRSKRLEDIYYFMDVWMPEAIICGIQERDNVERGKAEEIFRRGIQYTDEEMKRTADILIANATDANREKPKERSRKSLKSNGLSSSFC